MSFEAVSSLTVARGGPNRRRTPSALLPSAFTFCPRRLEQTADAFCPSAFCLRLLPAAARTDGGRLAVRDALEPRGAGQEGAGMVCRYHNGTLNRGPGGFRCIRTVCR